MIALGSSRSMKRTAYRFGHDHAPAQQMIVVANLRLSGFFLAGEQLVVTRATIHSYVGAMFW